MEFPAISQTRYEFWKEPQYTQSGMWWFTLAFGFFGLHHLLLRSPQTALVFLISNMLLLGYPWFYDLIQLSSVGGLDTESLNNFGMGHPWGNLGLAKGMWLKPDEEPAGKAPSPWWFLLYCITLPIGILANLIAGDQYNAFTRLLCLIIPFGSFLIFCFTIYDVFILLFSPDDLLRNGTKRLFPFTVLGFDYDGHSPNLTGHEGSTRATASCSKDGFFIGFLKLIGNIIVWTIKAIVGVATLILPEFMIPIELVFLEASTLVDDGIFVARDAVKLGTAVVEGAVEVGKEVAVGAAEVGTAFAETGRSAVLLAEEVGHLSQDIPSSSMDALQRTAEGVSKIQVQHGGAKNSLDYLGAGTIIALIAGGIVMATRK